MKLVLMLLELHKVVVLELILSGVLQDDISLKTIQTTFYFT